MATKDPNLGLVYSSDGGRMCPRCGQPMARCTCAKDRKDQARPGGDGIARVRRETKGRGGKTVCVIDGVPGTAAEVEALGKALKARCGTGGTVKDGVIEIQGDHMDTILAELAKRGLKAKRSGG